MSAAETLPGFPDFTLSMEGVADLIASWTAEHDGVTPQGDAQLGLAAIHNLENLELLAGTGMGPASDKVKTNEEKPPNIVDDIPGTMMLPETILESINNGDAAAFYSAKAAAASNLDAVNHQMNTHGESALQRWTNPSGQVIWACSAPKATFYSWAREVKETGEDGKENVKQIVQIGNYSASTGMTVRKEWKVFSTSTKVATGVLVSKLAWTFAKWVVNVTARKIAQSFLWAVLVGYLEGGGFLTPTVNTVLRVGGRTVSFASRAIFSSAASFFAALAVELLINYLGESYCLILDIMNRSDQVDWTVTEKYGHNEKINEGEWKSSTIPMKQKDNNSITGFVGGTVSKATVYYATYVFTQDTPLLGGFTAATSIVPSDKSEGIIVKYRVEKAAYNSMGVAVLKAGDASAKDNYDSVDMKKQNSVSIDKPLVKLLADQLFISVDNVYKCSVFIG